MGKVNKEYQDFFYNLILEDRIEINDDSTVIKIDGRQLKPFKNRNRGTDYYIGIYYKGRRILLHRLVYMYHTKQEIPDKLFINHIDGNKINNKIDNLECVTNGENVKHAHRIGLIVITDELRKQLSERVTGEKHPLAKLTDELVIRYRQKFKSGEMTKKEIINELGVARRTVEKFLNGSSWSHLNEIESPITNK